MKICYVASDVVVPHVRGASTHVYEISRNLVRLGHDVHLVSRRLGHLQRGYEKIDGIKIHRIYRGILFSPPLSSYLQMRSSGEFGLVGILYGLYLFTFYALYVGIVASEIVKQNRIDIIIERETSFGAGAIASALTGRPMVLEVIGPRISWISLKMAKKVIAYTELMVSDRTEKQKLALVTAAVDTALFKVDAEQRREIREKYQLGDSLVIGYIGTFQPWHGVEELVHASEGILKKYPHSRFLMVGPYYGTVEDLAKSLNLGDNFIFPGPVKYQEVPKYINASDILVAPYNPGKSKERSRYGIGSPLKIFEYMACAKPLVTTSVRPVTDVIANRVNGILVMPGDVKGLEQALLELIGDRETAGLMGMRAKESVERYYTWTHVASRIEQVALQVVRALQEGREPGHREGIWTKNSLHP